MKLNDNFSLTNMLSITKDKQTRILEKRVARNNSGGGNIFGGIGRQNINRN